MARLSPLSACKPGTVVYLNPSDSSYEPDGFAIVLHVHEKPVDEQKRSNWNKSHGLLWQNERLVSLLLIGKVYITPLQPFGNCVLTNGDSCVETSNRDLCASVCGLPRKDVSALIEHAKNLSAFCSLLDMHKDDPEAMRNAWIDFSKCESFQLVLHSNELIAAVGNTYFLNDDVAFIEDVVVIKSVENCAMIADEDSPEPVLSKLARGAWITIVTDSNQRLEQELKDLAVEVFGKNLQVVSTQDYDNSYTEAQTTSDLDDN